MPTIISTSGMNWARNTIPPSSTVRRRFQGLFRYLQAMSMIPQIHRGGLSAVSRLLENYDNMLSNLSGKQNSFVPSFDVRETEKAYFLDGDLPGVQQKDLEVKFENEHCLNIKAHSEHESVSEKDSWWVSERSVGDFRRTFNFPTPVDQEHTHARLKNGVLSLEIPKVSETHEKKKVSIEGWFIEFAESAIRLRWSLASIDCFWLSLDLGWIWDVDLTRLFTSRPPIIKRMKSRCSCSIRMVAI